MELTHWHCLPAQHMLVLASQRQIHEFALGGRPPPIPSFYFISLSVPSPPLPPRSRVPLNQLRRLGSAVSSPSGVRGGPGRKRIWCTLKLWQSHWWQSFWVFWSAYFTAELSKFSTRHNTVSFSLIRSTVTAWVRRPTGGRRRLGLL